MLCSSDRQLRQDIGERSTQHPTRAKDAITSFDIVCANCRDIRSREKQSADAVCVPCSWVVASRLQTLPHLRERFSVEFECETYNSSAVQSTHLDNSAIASRCTECHQPCQRRREGSARDGWYLYRWDAFPFFLIPSGACVRDLIASIFHSAPRVDLNLKPD